MNGAEGLLKVLVANDIKLCFANPGTSEMHIVAALEKVPEMRSVLALFEGVCSGAADGYARMTLKPASTLLHLGPGLGNALANLHNARRARSPLLNIVGDHALGHGTLQPPLASDISLIAKNVSAWVKADSTSETLIADTQSAIRATQQTRSAFAGQIATLIVPADAAWGDLPPETQVEDSVLVSPEPTVDSALITEVAKRIDERTLLLLDGAALSEDAWSASELYCPKSEMPGGDGHFPPSN